MTELVVWLDGALLPASRGSVSPFDHGLLTGDGIYETLLARGGVPFAWTRHLRRMRTAADVVDLTLPDDADMAAAVRETLDANPFDPARLRITLTGGPSGPGFGRRNVTPTLLVAAQPFDPFRPTAAVAVAPWPRNQRGALAGVKTISGGEAVRALAWARERGADEAIFADLDGHLCEGTSSNVFVVVDGQLRTPALSTGCLDGVTRQLVLEVLGPRLGVEVSEAETPVETLGQAEEAFLTSSTRGVQPIAQVDGRPLFTAPGPVTTALQAALAKLMDETPDP